MSPMLTAAYSVSFEFDTRAPLTHRGTVNAGSPASLAAKALREARKALQPRSWSSFVVVLEKRGDSEEGQ